MKLIAVVFSTMTLASIGATSLGDVSGVKDCLRRMETARSGIPPGELDRCIDLIRRSAKNNDSAIMGRVLAIANDDEIPLDTRAACLALACEAADESLAQKILAVGLQWADSLDVQKRPSEELAKDEVACARSRLLATLATKGAKSLNEVVPDRTPLLDLLFAVATRSWCGAEAKFASMEAMENCSAPIELRREYALKIIDAQRASTVAPRSLLSLLGPEAFPQLRQMVRASDDPEEFHFAAAAALAHFGDRQILPDLEAARPGLLKRHRNIEGYVIYYIWRINVQHPPTKLLEYIASGEDSDRADPRTWAVRRALELGVAQETVRKALLEHASKIEPTEYRQQSGRVVKLWGSLSTVKSEALKLGVLRPDDLPHVKIPKVEPTP